MKSESILRDGVVTLRQYDRLVESDYFKEIEAFSNDFIRSMKTLVHAYNKRWVADPLHQWSRQWEYPYIIDQARSLKSDAVVLDLGAGLSFLPHYLLKVRGIDRVIAVDYDPMLDGLYQKVNSAMQTRVEFQRADMRQLNDIDDGSIDYVYSVSVLEHTSGFPRIIEEAHRVLRPRGKLSVTFDISLDGLDDIPLEEARKLVRCLHSTFAVDTGIDLIRDVQNNDLVTSERIAARNKKLMPWRYPWANIFRPLVRHRKLGSPFKRLTFCCLTVCKSETASQ